MEDLKKVNYEVANEFTNRGENLKEYIIRIEERIKQIEQESRTDFLTGLLNRKAFEEIATREFNRIERLLNYNPTTFVEIDLDGFKAINDQKGHDAGDLLLKDFTSVILKTVRPTDYPFRWAGDEFFIILPETEPQGAEALVKRLRAESEKIGIRFSYGIAAKTYNSPRTLKQLYKVADSRLLENKKGKGLRIKRGRKS